MKKIYINRYFVQRQILDEEIYCYKILSMGLGYKERRYTVGDLVIIKKQAAGINTPKRVFTVSEDEIIKLYTKNEGVLNEE